MYEKKKTFYKNITKNIFIHLMYKKKKNKKTI